MGELDLAVVAAKNDRAKAEQLIIAQRWFILRCCADCCKRYISDSDDEFSVAMLAFYTAINSYDPARGGFLPYARLVMTSRLTDFMRKQAATKELAVSPAVFEGHIEDSLSVTEQAVVVQLNRRSLQEQQDSASEEIQAAGAVFAQYGFDFFALASCSPKSHKTKQSCRLAVLALLQDDALLALLRQTKYLPIKQIEKSSGVPRKILERHRKYIIAAVELLSGEYPHLSQYLQFITKEEH